MRIPLSDPRSDLATIYREIATLAVAGFSPSQSFDLLARQASGANRRCFEALMQRFWNGQRVSDAMRTFPRLFPAAHCAIVVEGEATGRLDVTLVRLAAMTEHSLALRQALRSELATSSITMIAAVLLAIFLLIGGFDRHILVIAIPLIAIYGLVLAAASLSVDLPGRNRLWAGSVAALIPTLRQIARNMTMIYFARSFSVLYSAGVPISPALRCAAEAAGDAGISKAARQAVARLDRGESVRDSLASTGFFPPEILGVIHAGEATGYLYRVLDSFAAGYEDETGVLLHQFGIRMGHIGLAIAAFLVLILLGAAFTGRA